jgi:class 6 POU domain transcription factor
MYIVSIFFFICRFEKLDITPKSAQKIKPVLERWMMEAEE